MLKAADEMATEEGFVSGHAECRASWEAVQLFKAARFPRPELGGKLVFKFEQRKKLSSVCVNVLLVFSLLIFLKKIFPLMSHL